MITEKQSKALYAIRAFAILSVILAHMPFGEAHPTAESVRIALGQVGVAVFFIVSGFFYKREQGDSKSFFLSKLKTIVVPWLLISIGTFAFSAVLSRDISGLPLSLVKWVLGVKTWYWYLPVLLVLYALFGRVYKNGAILTVCVFISIASVMLSAFGVIKYGEIFDQHFNVLNWVGLFALGCLIKKYSLIDRLSGVLPLLISLAVLTASVILSVKFGQDKAYIDYFSIPVEISGFVLLYNLSFALSEVKPICDIGKKSFFIYLIQMQPAGIINTRLPYNVPLFIIRPFAVLAALYLLSLLLQLVLKKLKLEKYAFVLALK